MISEAVTRLVTLVWNSVKLHSVTSPTLQAARLCPGSRSCVPKDDVMLRRGKDVSRDPNKELCE